MLKEFTKIFLISIIVIWGLGASLSSAESVNELKQNIESQGDKIKKLEEEIKAYNKQIEAVGAEATNLQNTVKTLDISQKKVGAEIQKTETNISKTNLTIESLGGEIATIEEKVASNLQAIRKTLSDMREKDEESLIESFLTNQSLAQVLDEYESISQFQSEVQAQSERLELYKLQLNEKKSATEGEKKKLVSLKDELGDQNQILSNTKKEKSTLLTQTKNKETEYKKIVATKQAEKERAEKELFDFESKLKRAIDPASFPSSGKGVLFPPLDNMVITQAFGRTVDAKKLYVSGTHNGVDFKASRGTPVKAALSGIVQGVGNTDAQKGCYSYGKWVLIKHPNGLTTMYAHFDLIKVTEGQSVETGEVIGYSGQTGYATGPHLHFTLYASQGVEVQKYSSSINCKNVSIPIAPSNAYLDPMPYF